eukprot:5299834-Pyramimonas_sp.AAC.1
MCIRDRSWGPDSLSKKCCDRLGSVMVFRGDYLSCLGAVSALSLRASLAPVASFRADTQARTCEFVKEVPEQNIGAVFV